MFNKLMMMGSLCLASALALGEGSAEAQNLNTSGTACRNYNASEALDVDYFTNAARNINPSPRSLICPIPRSPLTAQPFPAFYIDGHNAPNTSTSCTVTVYNYTGAGLASFFFTQTAGATPLDWDQPVNFTLAQLPTFAYASVLCTVPGGGNGLIYGMTAIQP